MTGRDMTTTPIEHAHMHVRLHDVRTTIELSDDVYRALRALAAARGERGFSPIVEAALREYMDRAANDGDADDAFAAARGAWSDEDAEGLVAEIEDAWSTWR